MSPDGQPGAAAPASPTTRVAVIGAGGVGGYFGAVLARAGHHVDMLARGAHLDAMRRRGGIEIREPRGATFVAAVNTTDDPAALLGANYALVAVKSYSLPEVAPAVHALAEAGAVVVPLLNGVDIADRLVALGVSRPAVLGGLTYVNVARTAPGVITRASDLCRIVIGELDGHLSDRAQQLGAVFRHAGVAVDVTETIVLELWRKFAFLTPMAAVCGLARRPVGAVRAAPYGRSVMERALREIVLVARAAGVAYGDEDAGRTLAALEALPEATQPSILADLVRGGPTEIDVLSGTVARMGRTLGVETPLHDFAVACVGAQERVTAPRA